jgi:hypothetical protein
MTNHHVVDDIDLWISDLQSLPRTPEIDIAINTVTAYAHERESQQFQPEVAPDELDTPRRDLNPTTDFQS